MIESGLKTAVFFSIFAHFLALFLIPGLIRKPADYPPLPYIVTLVAQPEPITDTSEKEAKNTGPAAISARGAEKIINTPSKEDFGKYSKTRISQLKEAKEQKDYVSDRLSAIGAKKALMRRAETKRTIDIAGTAASGSNTAGSSLDLYYGRVREDIWAEWVYPSDSKGLEAVVSITIMKDGSVRINGVEKSSGNPLFDRSALKAINRASPLAPPPAEIDLGIRFYP